ncbi:MAG TPA: diaminopimelate epimerase [Candidatus Limiplasma sp.]|nr:diaminopimelate epimerase [Candidatus Limiplasma sp.]HPS80715.1 diaminopimelate epimerase [Candidatus Limiplasma sp.]
MLRFTKMHGIGNDYIYINAFTEQLPEDLPALAVRMSDRRFGCGGDGIILIAPSRQADFRMRMFNCDGSESEMCGNGIRCVAAYCHDRGLTERTEFDIESGGAIKHMRLTLDAHGATATVRVDMGKPVTDGLSIPSVFSGDPVRLQPLTALGQTWPVTLVNMGNPHAVTFVEDPDTAPVTTVGPVLELDPAFPRKCNIEFVRVTDRGHIRMRVWERGAGETLACGTGACASAVASMLNGFTDRAVEVALRGGNLTVEWSEQDGHVYMTGPATFVYDGLWLSD